MRKYLFTAAVLAFTSLSAHAESACNLDTMDIQTYQDCVVVESSGESWASYQKEMERIEAEIVGHGTEHGRKHVTSTLAAK